MTQGTQTRKKYAASQVLGRTMKHRMGESLSRELETVSEEHSGEQERRQAILAGLFARAQTLVPDSLDSPTRKSCRESEVDEIITEKFRQQGFHL